MPHSVPRFRCGRRYPCFPAALQQEAAMRPTENELWGVAAAATGPAHHRNAGGAGLVPPRRGAHRVPGGRPDGSAPQAGGAGLGRPPRGVRRVPGEPEGEPRGAAGARRGEQGGDPGARAHPRGRAREDGELPDLRRAAGAVRRAAGQGRCPVGARGLWGVRAGGEGRAGVAPEHRRLVRRRRKGPRVHGAGGALLPDDRARPAGGRGHLPREGPDRQRECGARAAAPRGAARTDQTYDRFITLASWRTAPSSTRPGTAARPSSSPSGWEW